MNGGFILIIVIALVGLIVQSKLKSVFAKYSKISFPGGLTGREVAEKMLHDNDIYDVAVTSTPGSLTDHFNPQNKSVNLSQDVYNTCSISAAAVAAHECGHALQHAKDYAPLKLRSALVPIVSVSSSISQIVIIVGILLINTVPALFWLGI
ncbi:MAG: zinc metallopeptidase, partial [Rikenellaceae bacterium]